MTQDIDCRRHSSESSRTKFALAVEEFSESPQGLLHRPEAARALKGELRSVTAWSLNRKNAHLYGSPNAHSRKLCSFDGCDEIPIDNSHTIAKGAALAPIAEKQHLQRPQINAAGNLFMHPEGLLQASTFPGYCRTHEDLFQGFESQLELTEPLHFAQQIMRSAARESWRTLRQTHHFQTVLGVYQKTIANLPISEQMRDEWNRKILTPLQHLSNFTDLLMANLHLVHNDASRVVRGETAILPRWIVVHQHERTIPVAISGGTEFLSSDNRMTPMLFVSIPNNDHALTIIASLEEEVVFVHKYSQRNLNDTPSLDRAIRHWMTLTDHWFAQPSWWCQTSEPTRTLLFNSLGQSLLPTTIT
jgi:hypothetical protein